MAKITAERYHDISTGHRVVGHENKCRHLHGHNYRVHFTCESDSLDSVGRVIDFGVIKERLCMWLEDNWDHKFVVWERDTLFSNLTLRISCNPTQDEEDMDSFYGSIVSVPFNPTAENMAEYLVEVIGPQQLEGTGVQLTHVRIEETAKCSASYGV